MSSHGPGVDKPVADSESECFMETAPIGSRENSICIDDSDDDVAVSEELVDIDFDDREDLFPPTPPPSTSRACQDAQNIFSPTGFDEDEVLPGYLRNIEDQWMREIQENIPADNLLTAESSNSHMEIDNEVPEQSNVDQPSNEEPGLQSGGNIENTVLRDVSDLYSAQILDEETAFENNVGERSFLVTVNNDADALVRADNSELFGAILQDLVARHVERESNFHVGLTITPYEEAVVADDGQDVRPFFVAYKHAHQLTSDMLSRQISPGFQSGGVKMFDPQNKLKVVISTVNFQQGSGKKRPDMRQLLERQRELVPTINKGKRRPGESVDSAKNITKNTVTKLCFGTAVLQAICYIAWKEQKIVSLTLINLYREKRDKWLAVKEINSHTPGKYAALFQEARSLLQNAGIQKETDFSLEEDLELLLDSLFNYTLVVMGEDHSDDSLYVGNPAPYTKTIGLLLRDGHYQFIKSLPAFTNSRFYSVACNVRGNNKMQHYKCKLACKRCFTPDCPRNQDGYIVRCDKCSAVFNHPECYRRHSQRGPLGGKSYCEHTKKCKDCSELYYTTLGDRHVCNSGWCNRCKLVKPDDHKCYMMPAREPLQSEFKRIYFDFETATYFENGRHFHKVVAAVAFRCCSRCMDNMPQSVEDAVNATCTNCCGDESKLTVFEEISPENRHVNVIETFVKWLFRTEHKGYACMAHNLKSFDGQFILREMLKNNKVRPANKLIVDGRKINGIIMKNKQRLLDSVNFVPFGLAAFPKAFGVRSWFKSEFPYAFIRPENYEHDGPMPDISMVDHTWWII